MRRIFPDHTYNWTTLLGTAIALFAIAAILILYGMSILKNDSNPYLGIFMLVLFPAIMIFGLALIPIGMVRARRRRGEAPIVDLRIPQHRNAALWTVVGGSMFLLASTVGLFETYEYAESNQFCGVVCHVPMTPEYTAFQTSPHANIHCVDCHVGPGADYFVKAKINGARQLYHLARGDFQRPIPTPVEFLRPARDICEQCHWPEKLYATREKHFQHFLADEANTPWSIRMLMPIGTPRRGGGRSGIHWHADAANRIEYVASDHSRMSFDQVTLFQGDSSVVYTADGAPLSETEWLEAESDKRVRTFDCLDCHNRPSHQFESPMVAVNEALAAGTLDASLPWIKRQAMQALTPAYGSTQEAHASIATRVRQAFPNLSGQAVDSLVSQLRALHDANLFPEMRVRWEAYPDHAGHMLSPGCFRCHGSSLQTSTGRRISNDCSLCHTIIAQGPPNDPQAGLQWSNLGGREPEGLVFRHPLGIDAAETILNCWECHRGGDEVYLP